MFGVYLINGVIYQLTQSQWLYCSDVEDEVFCLILLPPTKSSHHPVQIAINMSRKTAIALHETVCHIAAPCSRQEPARNLHISLTRTYEQNVLPYAAFFIFSLIVTTNTHIHAQIFLRALHHTPTEAICHHECARL